MVSGFYKPCGNCGWWIDDGTFRGGKYLCQDCFSSVSINYSYLTKRSLFLIATDDSKKMSHRYAAVRELQNRRKERVKE